MILLRQDAILDCTERSPALPSYLCSHSRFYRNIRPGSSAFWSEASSTCQGERVQEIIGPGKLCALPMGVAICASFPFGLDEDAYRLVIFVLKCTRYPIAEATERFISVDCHSIY